ncbi:MAG: hypothetical protein P4L84_13305 [Isosphaeraceae bacterium]|nr:hypothetical protein [Isosphaeraceae bacterium]
MPSDPEGLVIARARIAAEQEQRTGFLDLGRLGLTEFPEELFALEHLQGLNLGMLWRDEQGEWQQAASDLSPNQLTDELGSLSRFAGLRRLSISHTEIRDLGPLSGLTALRSLDCRWARISNVTG